MKKRPMVLAIALLLASPGIVNANDASHCGDIADDAARLACYDAEFRTPAAASSPELSPSEPHAAAATDEPRLEDLGVPGSHDEEEAELQVRGRVVRCELNANKRYVFVFDNGNAWKQVSSKRLRLRNCDFPVTVAKDLFGYKMQIDGEKSTIRISRVR